jgi:hypothetical protein
MNKIFSGAPFSIKSKPKQNRPLYVLHELKRRVREVYLFKTVKELQARQIILLKSWGRKRRAGETFWRFRRRFYVDESLPALEDPTKLLGGAVYGGACVWAVSREVVSALWGAVLHLGRCCWLPPLPRWPILNDIYTQSFANNGWK